MERFDDGPQRVIEEGLISEYDEAQLDDVHDQLRIVHLSADSFGDWLNRIGRQELLTAEQEVVLGREIEVGLFAQERLATQAETLTPQEKRELLYLQNRGDAAKSKMVQANLRLVVSIARRYTNHGLEISDLVQEGNTGLLHAVELFDQEKGFKFSTYATWWIRQAITRALANQSRTIRLPVHLNDDAIKASRARGVIAQLSGHEATDEEIAQETGLSVEKIREINQYNRPLASLNVTIGEEGDTEFGDLITDTHEPAPDAQLIKDSLKEDVLRLLDDGVLSDKERNVLKMRFGIDTRIHTVPEVAAALEVTTGVIRSTESRALERLRRKHMLDSELLAHIRDEA